jgi:hypothetical protein
LIGAVYEAWALGQVLECLFDELRGSRHRTTLYNSFVTL